MAIVHQSATTEVRVSTRPPAVRSPHELVGVQDQPAALTILKIVGLVVVAALGTAFAVALVLGSALFLLFSLN